MIIRTEEGSLELWLEVVRGIIGRPTEDLTLLDLCCGECTGTSLLQCKFHVGIDVVDWPTRPLLSQYLKCDALDFCLFSLEGFHFNLCICSDGLEHLPREAGLKLLKALPAFVAPLSIIFTPIGPWKLDADATHPDTHKSAWLPEELEAIGWNVVAFPNWHQTLGVGAFFASKGRLE